MTTRRRLKRLVRARAAKTGESYTSALRHFRDQTPEERVMSSDTEERVPARCSFCSKSQHDVRKMIGGPGGIFICDACVLLCAEIVAPYVGEAHGVAPPSSPPLSPELEARVRRLVAEAVGRIEAETSGGAALAGHVDVVATADGIRVDIHTPRPGALIGRGGTTIEALRSGLAEVVGGQVTVNVVPATP